MKKKTNLSNIIVTTIPSEKKVTTSEKWKPSFPLREDWGKGKSSSSGRRGRKKTLKKPRRKRLSLTEKLGRYSKRNFIALQVMLTYKIDETKSQINKVRYKIKTLKTKSSKLKWKEELRTLKDNLKFYKNQRNSILYPKGDYIDTPFNEEDKQWGGITYKNFVDEFKGKPIALIQLSDTETNHFDSFVDAYFNGNKAWAEKAYEEGLALYYKGE